MSSTPTETQPIPEIQNEIVEEFELFDTPQERYGYLIDIAKKLPPMPEDLKIEENQVRGCQSQVWIHAAMDEGKVRYHADSDGIISRGLVSLVLRVYSGHTPDEIIEANPDFIDRIGMGTLITPSRSNGLHSMIKQVKLYALAFKAQQG